MSTAFQGIVIVRVGRLACRLDFPAHCQIHPFISIANLAPARNKEDHWTRQPNQPHLPTVDERFPGDIFSEIGCIRRRR